MNMMVAKGQVHGGTKRASGSTLTRFVGTAAHGQRYRAALQPHHAAILESRTLFPKSVVQPEAARWLLISGHNSAKIGSIVTIGPWIGMPIYTFALEERATCPSSCALWLECYGNAMPFARRHAYTPRLLPLLDAELYDKACAHPRGFVIRLHVLGDFPDRAYLLSWVRWMQAIPQLHVWGYTAHRPHSRIGRSIARMNARWPDRWAVRFSVPLRTDLAPMQATTVWARPDGTLPGRGEVDGVICPAQTHQTAACATCGVCWAPAAAKKRIVFLGHGMNGRRTSA